MVRRRRSGIHKDVLGREIAMPVIWFDPLEEPMKLLIFSIILGAIHLFVGMGIQAYMLIKDGKPWDALFDIGFWYMLIIGLVLFALGGSVAAILSTIGMWLAIVGAVGILLTGGRNKKGFGKITGGLGSLYGITSYLSDALSYSRLLALGLATGVVAKVVNIPRFAGRKRHSRTYSVYRGVPFRNGIQPCDKRAGRIRSLLSSAICGVLRKILYRRRKGIRAPDGEYKICEDN